MSFLFVDCEMRLIVLSSEMRKRCEKTPTGEIEEDEKDDYWRKWTSASTPRFSLAGRDVNARLLDVHDGDTLIATIKIFPGRVYSFSVRLLGIDTPEAARIRLVQLVVPKLNLNPSQHLTRSQMQRMLHEDVHLVRLLCSGMDKYGRILSLA